MYSVLGLLLIATTTPAPGQPPSVTVGPESSGRAGLVEAPISEVMTFSDRARIRRKATVRLSAGTNLLRFPDIGGAALLDTVRVSSKVARVLRVEATPVTRERFGIDQIEAALNQVDQLTDEMLSLEQRIAVEQNELDFLNRIKPAPPVREAERDGRPALKIDPRSWFSVIDFFSARRTRAHEHVQQLRESHTKLLAKKNALIEDIQRQNAGGFSEQRIEVLVVVDSASAKSDQLVLEYFIPGAWWKPVYDLELDPHKQELTVRTAAMVSQATGEDWERISLAVSTAIPGRGIEAPELLTWTLGESRDFLPAPRPARPLATAPRFPPPARRLTETERAEIDRNARVNARLAALGQNVVYKKKTIINFSDDAISGELARPDGAYVESRKKERPRRSRPPPPPPPPMPSDAPAAAPMPVMEADSAYEEESMSIASYGGATSRSESFARTALQMFDARGPAAPRFSDPDLPAVSGGGLDYVYKVGTPATIDSSNDPRRIPLSAVTYPVETFYEATPSLATTAYLKARVVNRGKQALLRGPVNVFVGNEFVAEGRIETTGPGGTMEFPLGADENVRLNRKVLPSSTTEGFISKDDVTTYTTVIEVGNYKRKPIRIEVVDQVPKTRDDDVEIELAGTHPAPLAPPDANGLVRWRLDVPAGATKKIELKYVIKRPTGYELRQY